MAGFNHEEWSKKTSIHTRINETIRISSIFREHDNYYFSSRGWETFVWRLEDGNEKIIYEADCCDTIDQVMKIHKDIYDKITNGISLEIEEDRK